MARAGVDGMPVEFTPIGDPSGPRRTADTGGQPNWPRPGDGWARSAVELEDAWGIVTVLVDTIAATPDRSAADLSPGERYTLGVRAAARWTLGMTPRSPLSGQAGPPDRDRVAAELALADVFAADGGLHGDPAAGVRAWLAWLTGTADELVFVAL